MMTVHLPLSAGRITIESFFRSCVMACLSPSVRLLRGGSAFSKMSVTSARTAAASPLCEIFLHASSVATMKSSKGIVLGEIA